MQLSYQLYAPDKPYLSARDLRQSFKELAQKPPEFTVTDDQESFKAAWHGGVASDMSKKVMVELNKQNLAPDKIHEATQFAEKIMHQICNQLQPADFQNAHMRRDYFEIAAATFKPVIGIAQKFHREYEYRFEEKNKTWSTHSIITGALVTKLHVFSFNVPTIYVDFCKHPEDPRAESENRILFLINPHFAQLNLDEVLSWIPTVEGFLNIEEQIRGH